MSMEDIWLSFGGGAPAGNPGGSFKGQTDVAEVSSLGDVNTETPEASGSELPAFVKLRSVNRAVGTLSPGLPMPAKI